MSRYLLQVEDIVKMTTKGDAVNDGDGSERDGVKQELMRVVD